MADVYSFPENNGHEDDDEDGRYIFKKKKDSTTIEYDYVPLFSYEYIDLNKTDYSFSQTHFHDNDIVEYFTKVKLFSTMTIDEMIHGAKHHEHLHLIEPPFPPKLKYLIRQIAGRTDIDDEHMPPIGQFGLYTSKNGLANRSKGIKSPRIFFFIGDNAVIHVLLYDPFHEVFPKRG